MNLIGRFYFIRTVNGNLIGEFSNNHNDRIYTEGANLIGNSTGFIGLYNSTWATGNVADLMILEITQRPNTNNRIFTLSWTRNNNQIFVGEAMLFEDKLIGDYRML